MTQYQGDALWGACPDGGDIEIQNGTVIRSGGLSAAVYISMFGGNQEDAGSPDSKLQWWGNYLEEDPDRHIRGRTGTLIAGLPLSSGNLVRLEESTRQDLAWMLSTGVATEIEASAALVAGVDVEITVVVNAFNVSETFVFVENWLAGPNEPALTCG